MMDLSLCFRETQRGGRMVVRVGTKIYTAECVHVTSQDFKKCSWCCTPNHTGSQPFGIHLINCTIFFVLFSGS